MPASPPIIGPVFVSHSAQDADDVNALTLALRTTFQGGIRMFNTSSGAAIETGANWRSHVLAALEAAPIVILWATRSALTSPEVAFEIGAAFAYGRPVLPCCVHVAPASLPWSLSELQALTLDSEEGWLRLAQDMAAILDFPGVLDAEPLRTLAHRFEAPADALQVTALGWTLEFANRSSSAISEIGVSLSGEAPSPEWAEALQAATLGPGETVVLFRDAAPAPQDVVLEWTDITGATRTRSVSVPPTPGAT